jgi:uncharacterized UPF0160 family protein
MTGRVDRNAIIRTREMALLNQCEYVCDVGGIYEPALKRFDHHQREYVGSLSSAGMILDYLRSERLLPAQETDFLNHSLIRGIDAHDNGKDPQIPGFCLFSHVISNFNPIQYEASAEELLAGYLSAVDFTLGHIHRSLERYRYNQSARTDVQKAMSTNTTCLIFDRHIPWIDSFFELGGERHPAKFIVMPVGEQWKVRGIPPTNDDRMSVRMPLPASWAGRMGAELSAASGIEGAVFCHKGRFISMWKTKQAALEAVTAILSSHKEKR